MVELYNGISYGYESEKPTTACSNMGKSQKENIEWVKADLSIHVDFSHLKFQKKQNKLMASDVKMVATL